MLAKNLRAPRGVRLPALSLTFIASLLAPTGDRVQPQEFGRLSGRLRRQAGTPQTSQTKKPHENPKVLMRLFRFGDFYAFAAGRLSSTFHLPPS
jgi:hypothetical protein